MGADSGMCDVDVEDELNAGTGGKGRSGVAGTWAPLGAGVVSGTSIWFAMGCVRWVWGLITF